MKKFTLETKVLFNCSLMSGIAQNYLMCFLISDQSKFVGLCKVLTFISIRKVHTMAAIDTRITNTPDMCFAGLPRVFCRTRASKIVENDKAFSSILTRLDLQWES